MKTSLPKLLIFLILLSATGLSFAQNVDYSATCIATKMKHDCDFAFNEEGRFSVQISDNLNFGIWYKAGDGAGDMNKCLICDGDANTSGGYTCNWNILLVSKTDVSVSTLRLSFRATDDDAASVVNDWWMDDDCTYTLSGQDVTLTTQTPGINNDIVVGQSVDPEWYVTYRIFWNWVTVNQPSTPTAHANPSCGSTYLNAIASTQNDVTWYWQGTNAAGTSTANPSTANYTIDSTGMYYLRAKGNSNDVWSTASSSVYIVVKTGSTAATGINVTNNNTPHGTVKTLSIVGGELGTGADWKWYGEPGCVTLLGSGSFIDVDPLTTKPYYARAEGDCDTTLTVSTTVVVAASGIDALTDFGGKIEFYPNPASDKFMITVHGLLEDTEIHIFNFQGQEVISYLLEDGVNEIAVENLPKGVYLLDFLSGNHQVLKKLVKN
jgi:hypothetical protein